MVIVLPGRPLALFKRFIRESVCGKQNTGQLRLSARSCDVEGIVQGAVQRSQQPLNCGEVTSLCGVHHHTPVGTSEFTMVGDSGRAITELPAIGVVGWQAMVEGCHPRQYSTAAHQVRQTTANAATRAFSIDE